MNEKEITVAPVVKRELVLEGDPEKQLEFAKKAANALMKVVKPAQISGKDYLQFGGWQTLGRFFGATVGVEWTKPIVVKDQVVGFEARAEVLQHGVKISSAEASCLRSERNWKTREEFALKSMAQTRASAKALRNAFGWVAELAGLESTPAEEMTYDSSPVADNAPVVVAGADTAPKPKIKAPKIVEENRKKKEIKDLVDSIVINPLDQTPEAYQTWVYNNTMFLLVPENYDEILVELKKIKNGEHENVN